MFRQQHDKSTQTDESVTKKVLTVDDDPYDLKSIQDVVFKHNTDVITHIQPIKSNARVFPRKYKPRLIPHPPINQKLLQSMLISRRSLQQVNPI